LPADHHGEHQWTPEPIEIDTTRDERATGYATG